MSELTPYQLGYLDGAYDQAYWRGEESSHDYIGPITPNGEYKEYDDGYCDGWENTQQLDEEYVNDARNWQEWLESPAKYAMPTVTATINRLFVEYEATIAELRNQLREQQTRSPHYTHRNGESDLPTVDGYYWCYDKHNLHGGPIIHEWMNSDKCWHCIRNGPGPIIAIYGPIPQPITGGDA